MDFFATATSHYERGNLTQRWDDYFGFRSQPVADLCLKYLQLQPDDLLVDIGAGNGNTTEPLWKKGILKHPILCVDPSSDMLQGCKSREGLETLQASAFEFFSEKFHHNKVLIAQCIHLWPDHQETFDRMFRNSPQNAVFVVIMSVPKTKRAYWKAARESFEATFVAPDKVEEALGKAGFKLKTTDEVIVYTPTKAEWYRNLRNRSTVCLEPFSDEEIEEGLREVDRDFFAGVLESEQVEVTDNVVVIVATKN